jgi:hypothetical protein
VRSASLLALAIFLSGAAPCLSQGSPAAGTPSVDAQVEDPIPGPPPPLPDLADPNSRTGESLAEPGEASGIPKALRSSGQKAGGPANDLNPSGQREPELPAVDLAGVASGRKLYHGNYCGKGQAGDGAEAVDALDEVCRRHDACYDAAGYASCACDKTLRKEASAVSARPDVPTAVRGRALSVAEASDVMSCKTP